VFDGSISRIENLARVEGASAQSTERICFSPLRLQRAEALALIQRLAERHSVQIDAVDEQPRLVSVDLRVTVSAAQRDIEAFAREAGGRREGDPPRTIRRWAGELIAGVSSNWP
jgi:hypothetical protein